MSRATSQQRTAAGILSQLQPHWRSEAGLPLRIEAILRADRRLGSRDRRAYREIAYTALRYLPWIEPLLASDPGAAVARAVWLAGAARELEGMRAELTQGMPACPEGADAKAALLGADAGALSPAWLRTECPAAFAPPLREALLRRAPLWLRLQAGDPAAVREEFGAKGWPWEESPLLAGALKLPHGTNVSQTQAFLSGAVEIQDLGSQLVLAGAGVKPGGRWLDACAGAGGKTLQMAALVGSSGSVTARDPRRGALDELGARAARAGLLGRIRVGDDTDPEGGFDGVLVDAPCSGSGTWRRAPHLRWVTQPAGVERAASLQLRLLVENARKARPGGLVVYSTCSLCRSENEAVAEDFLRKEGGFSAEGAFRTLLPQEHDGDGFFAARFRRAAASL